MVMRLDRSDRTTVVVCTCGWRQLTLTTDRVAAWAIARDHEVSVHSGTGQAVGALATATRRAGLQ